MPDNPQGGTGAAPELEDEEGAAAIDSLMDDVPEDQQQAPAPGADDDPEDEAEDQSEDESQATPATVKLQDGTEASLAEIEEWRQGNLRQGDYTRKTQEIAAQRREIDSHVATYTSKVQQIDRAFQIVLQAAQTALPKVPDEATLLEDPIAYMQQKAHYDSAVSNLQMWITSKQQFDNQQTQEQQQYFRQWAENERNLAQQKVPELQNPTKATELRNQFVKWAPHYGYSAQDVAGLWDHRMLMLARDAVRYRELLSKKPKSNGQRPAPKVQQPGNRPNPGARNARSTKDKLNRLASTGSMEAGASVIEDILGPG